MNFIFHMSCIPYWAGSVSCLMSQVWCLVSDLSYLYFAELNSKCRVILWLSKDQNWRKIINPTETKRSKLSFVNLTIFCEETSQLTSSFQLITRRPAAIPGWLFVFDAKFFLFHYKGLDKGCGSVVWFRI